MKLGIPIPLDRASQPSPEMERSVTAVEKIVDYKFKNRRLLEKALTHSSITYFASYKRLALLGDAALGIAISKHLFCTYPDFDQGHLSSLREANVSTEKFARVAVRHGLYWHLRRSALESLDHQVREFTEAVVNAEGPEGEAMYVYGGSVAASKVLADIVESVAAAVYIDMDYDLNKLWTTFKPLLEPIVTPEELQGHPVTMLYKLCDTHRKKVNIEQQRDETKNISIASVYVDGVQFASHSSKHKEIARLHAAKIALDKLSKSMSVNDSSFKVIAGNQAKQKLKELCEKKRLPQPSYKIETESGPAHAKKYVSSVTIATLDGHERCMTGDEGSSKLEAERSAASLMIYALRESDYCVMNTKESDWLMMGNYVPSVERLWAMACWVDSSLWAMACWVMRLSVFCLKAISLLVSFFVLVLLVIGCIHASYNSFY